MDMNFCAADNALKQAILVVSFGTSYNETREAAIGAIENEIRASFPEYDVKRAFTSRTVIKILRERDGEETDNVTEAMDKLSDEGYKTVIVQPTHVMSGYENDEMNALVKPYRTRIENLFVGAPMLFSESDYDKVISALSEETPDMKAEDRAVIFVGHGTGHKANSVYAALGERLAKAGYARTFVGTVEAKPDIEDVKAQLKKSGVNKVTLLPLMIVAGDHAVNDICGGTEHSWRAELERSGFEVKCVKKGLGEYKGVREIFAYHIRDAVSGCEG